MKYLAKLLSNSNDASMVRLMSLISLMAGIILAYNGKSGFEIFVISAFAGKVAQKVVEVKNG